MDAHEAREVLAYCSGDQVQAVLPASVLSKLSIDDLPDGGMFQVGDSKDGVTHLDWNGTVLAMEHGFSGKRIIPGSANTGIHRWDCSST